MAVKKSNSFKYRNKKPAPALSLNYTICLLFIILHFVVLPIQVLAQQKVVKTGSRVKLEVPTMSENKFIGMISSMSDSTMVLEVGTLTYIIPVASIENMAISTGKRKHIGRGVFLGSLGGAAIGAIIGSIAYDPCQEGSVECIANNFFGSGVFIGTSILGTVSGALVGGIVGSVEKESWEKVPREVLFNMEPVGTLQPEMYPQLTLRWRFGSKK